MKLVTLIAGDVGLVMGARGRRGAVDRAGGLGRWRFLLPGSAMVVKRGPVACCKRRRLRATVIPKTGSS